MQRRSLGTVGRAARQQPMVIPMGLPPGSSSRGSAVMAQLSESSPAIAVLIAGAVFYVFVWFATRNLSRAGKILARLAPLGLVIPAMVYLSSLWGERAGLPPAASPPQGPMVEYDGRRPGSSSPSEPPA